MADRREWFSTEVLQLTHMETIGIRQLQQHASAAIRRVVDGETLGITDRGRLVAVLSPPSELKGLAAMDAAGLVRWGHGSVDDLPPPQRSSRTIQEVLDELSDEG